MRFSDADQAAMLAAVGEVVTIGGSSVVADFRLESADLRLFEADVIAPRAELRVSAEIMQSTGAAPGTAVTARGGSYVVSEVRQEQSGFWLLTLTEAA